MLRKQRRPPEWVATLMQQLLSPPLFLQKIKEDKDAEEGELHSDRKATKNYNTSQRSEEDLNAARQERRPYHERPRSASYQRQGMASVTPASFSRRQNASSNVSSNASSNVSSQMAPSKDSTQSKHAESMSGNQRSDSRGSGGPHSSTSSTTGTAASASGKRTTGTAAKKANYSVDHWRTVMLSQGIPMQVIKNYGWKVSAATVKNTVIQVKTASGTFALKPTDLEPSRILFMREAEGYVRNNGFPRMALFVLGRNKQPFVRQNGQQFYATQWIQGRTSDFSDKDDVARVAEALAKFHDASHGFESSKYNPPMEFDLQHMLRRRHEDLKILLAQADSKRNQGTFDKLLLSIEHQLHRDAQESLDVFDNPDCQDFLLHEEFQPGLCHLDVIPGNFIVDKANQVHLIDLDLMTFAPRALDMAHLLRRSLQIQNWDPELAYKCFLNFDNVRTIEKEEYLLTLALLKFPYRAWRLANTRYRVFAEPAQVSALKRYQEQEENRQQFLRELEQQIT